MSWTELRSGAAAILLWALLLSLAGLTFLKQASLCSFPYQVEPTEAGMLQSAKVLAQGGDPWAPATAPENYNAYGLGFPWLAAQWHRLQPALPWLLLLRMCAALGALLALLAACVALSAVSAGALETAAFAVLLYPVLLFPDSFAARPDALGVGLYLAALVWAQRPSVGDAAIAALLGVLAFFTKSYMGLALPVSLLLLWAQGRRRHACIFAWTALAAAAAMTAMICWRHPHYFEGTLLVNAAAPEKSSWHWAWRQLRDLGRLHWPLLLAALLSALWALRRGSLAPRGPARLWAWATLPALLALAAGLGGHEGAYLRYYDQLLLPPLLLALFFWLKQQGWGPRALSGLLLLNAFFCTFALLGWNRPSTPARLAEWARADAWVQAHPFGMYPAVMASLSIEHGGFVTDTGHTYVLKNSRWRGQPSTLAKASLRRDRWLTRQLEQGRLQSVVCGQTWECPPGLEKMGYRQVDQFCMDPPICFKVYVPRKAPPKPEAYVYAEDDL